MEKGKRKNHTSNIPVWGKGWGDSGHIELPLKTFQCQGIGEKKVKKVRRCRGVKPEHTWKLLCPSISIRLCQAYRLHQGTHWGGAEAQRGIMKVIPVCQRDSLQEDGWEGQ